MHQLDEVGFRHLWGQAKREELIETAEKEPGKIYESIEPVLPLGLPFVQTGCQQGLVRLAGTARFVSGVVSRRQDQPR